MNDLIINIAAGLISGVLTPFVVTRLGGGTPPPTTGQSVHVVGDGNAVQQIDASQHEHNTYTWVENRPTKASAPGPPAGDDDAWARIALALAVAGVLVLAYLLVWPIVVWALAGAGLGLTIATAWIHRTTEGTPGPRTGALLLALTSAGLLLLAAWWTLNGGPGSSLSGSELESRVIAQFPEFGSSVSGRWSVTSGHAVEVLRIVGWSGMFFVLTQIIAMECAVLLIWARTRELVGWVAMRNLVSHPDKGHLLPQAHRFTQIGASAIGFTLLAGLVLVGTSGGWAHTWIDDMQSRQTDAIVGSR